MSWRDFGIEQSRAFAESYRAFARSVDRGYESLLEFAPDPRRDRRPGIVASAAFHLLLLAAIFFWTHHRAGRSGDALRPISIDIVIVMQHHADNAHALGVTAPKALVPEPIAPIPSEMNLTPLLPSLGAPSAEDDAPSPTARRQPGADAKQSTKEDQTSSKSAAQPPAQRSSAGSGSATPAGKGDGKDFVVSLRDQILACWNPQTAGADKVVLDFDLFFNPDGSISRPPELTASYEAAANRDPALRSEAEALRRAIYTCAPYKLPVGHYADWQTMTAFHFDSSAPVR